MPYKSKESATELHELLNLLEDDELIEYAERVREGKIVGHLYISTVAFPGCGCIYGTAELLSKYNASEVGRHYMHLGLVPLEQDVAFNIGYGDTPDTNEYSKWLYEHVMEYIHERNVG